jgi:hypothetical protein
MRGALQTHRICMQAPAVGTIPPWALGAEVMPVIKHRARGDISRHPGAADEQDRAVK